LESIVLNMFAHVSMWFQQTLVHWPCT